MVGWIGPQRLAAKDEQAPSLVWNNGAVNNQTKKTKQNKTEHNIKTKQSKQIPNTYFASVLLEATPVAGSRSEATKSMNKPAVLCISQQLICRLNFVFIRPFYISTKNNEHVVSKSLGSAVWTPSWSGNIVNQAWNHPWDSNPKAPGRALNRWTKTKWLLSPNHQCWEVHHLAPRSESCQLGHSGPWFCHQQCLVKPHSSKFDFLSTTKNCPQRKANCKEQM